MPKRHEIIGLRSGRLLVIGNIDDGTRNRRVLCRCDCGIIKPVIATEIRRGSTRSCGCLSRDLLRLRCTKHGEGPRVTGHRTPEYLAWQEMKRRCYTPGRPGYQNYGGRGIKVCDEWRDDFMAFIAHVGRRPSDCHSLDRIDVNGNYEPGNMRWATYHEQRMNQRRMSPSASR